LIILIIKIKIKYNNIIMKEFFKNIEICFDPLYQIIFYLILIFILYIFFWYINTYDNDDEIKNFNENF